MELSGIRAGDLVLVDGPAARGSDGRAADVERFYCEVKDNPGGGRLTVARINGRDPSWFSVRSLLIVGHFRATIATRRARGLVAA